ncbi:hypothetical protein BUALT_Bualt07G0169000 [Buddleja alternifolia]|uniref:J domain-containing protein n=1 Tax=Buddleja alternifolia TaxID=168488 RepID=A0AAV6XCM0_9LAMI|nr:hypothetical protein BUALT_Bualt07G0169000 [Buddleja alternifolia]
MSRFRALWQASLNATKRALTWNLEDMVPPSERYIFRFDSKEELKRWHLYSDSEYGGLSSASLQITDSVNGSSGTGVFSGNLSLDVDEGSKWNISRGGFCGMRSKKISMRDSEFDGFIDLDPYDTLAVKLKGDGRCYISTIYTENWVNSPGQQEDNSWQAFVFVPKDNCNILLRLFLIFIKKFEILISKRVCFIEQIPLARYLPTWRGNVIDANLEMNPSRVVGMSLSVNAEGGVPGSKTGPAEGSNDFYGVLGLKKECTTTELRNAYKKLALKWHPDRCSASGNLKYMEEAKKKFQAIQQAYSVLSDANKRFLYDVGVYDCNADDDEDENRNETFEELQELFDEMFQSDIEGFDCSPHSTTPPSYSSSSQASCSDSYSISNKRNSSEFSSGNFRAEATQLQGFCMGTCGTSGKHQVVRVVGERIQGSAGGKIKGRKLAQYCP